MLKNKRTAAIISILAAVILMGISAGVVFAQDENDAKIKDCNPIFTRVAEIMGVDEQELENAFKQAMKEQKEQMLNERMQKLVEDGKLTSEEANKYKEWLEARPDIQLPFKDRMPPFKGTMPRGFQKLDPTIPETN